MLTDWINSNYKLVTWLDEDAILKMTGSLHSISKWKISTNDLFKSVAGHSHLVHYTPDLISELGSGSYYCERFVVTPEATLIRIPPFLRHACKSAAFKIKQLDTDSPEPLVTVIVTTYNREESCVKSVKSALAQTYRNIRCLVVKDGPGEYKTLPSDPRVEFFSLPRRGRYPESGEKRWHLAGRDPWNYANAMTEGPIICPLDDDDLFYPDHIETIVEEWKKSKAHLIYTESNTCENETPFNFDFDPELLKKQNIIFTCASAYCGAAITLTYSPLQVDLPGDWAGLIRVQEAGLVFRKINKITSEHAIEYPTRKRRKLAREMGLLNDTK